MSITVARALPTGTRPEAMPPIAAPRKNGISTDESANSRAEHAGLADRRRLAAQRERGAAEDDPDRGEEQRDASVEKIEPKATGNAVQTITRMKISQTWLASQTGLIERWIMPAHAPAARGAAGGQVPEAGAEVGAAEHRVGRDPEHEEPEADVGQHQPTAASRAARPRLGRLARGGAAARPPPRRAPA